MEVPRRRNLHSFFEAWKSGRSPTEGGPPRDLHQFCIVKPMVFETGDSRGGPTEGPLRDLHPFCRIKPIFFEAWRCGGVPTEAGPPWDIHPLCIMKSMVSKHAGPGDSGAYHTNKTSLKASVIERVFWRGSGLTGTILNSLLSLGSTWTHLKPCVLLRF